jgi:translation initiation factor IF-2
VAKTRVHELAKEFGVESKFVLEKFKEMGEFVKSASSTVELPAEMRFRKEYGDKLKADLAGGGAAPAAEAPAKAPAKKAPAKKTAAKTAAKKAVSAADLAAGNESEVTTPVGTTGAAAATNPDTTETDLQQVGTEPLMDPSLTNQIKSEAETAARGSDVEKG